MPVRVSCFLIPSVESLHALGGDGGDALVQGPCTLAYEVAHQQENILRPVVQWGHGNGKKHSAGSKDRCRNWPASTMCPRSRLNRRHPAHIHVDWALPIGFGRYEYLPESSETMIYVVMSRLVLCHLAHPAPYSIATRIPGGSEALHGLSKTLLRRIQRVRRGIYYTLV